MGGKDSFGQHNLCGVNAPDPAHAYFVRDVAQGLELRERNSGASKTGGLDVFVQSKIPILGYQPVI